MTFVLHHLDTAKAQAVLKKAQAHTRAGGVHVIVTFANAGELYTRNKHSQRYYPSQATLGDLYADWTILKLEQKEVTTMAKHKDGTPMKNQLLTVIAQK